MGVEPDAQDCGGLGCCQGIGIEGYVQASQVLTSKGCQVLGRRRAMLALTCLAPVQAISLPLGLSLAV